MAKLKSPGVPVTVKDEDFFMPATRPGALSLHIPERVKDLGGLKTTLERVGVHRLVAAVREWTEEIMEHFMFEPNDEITRESVFLSLSNMMDELHKKKAIYDFRVVCDESINGPEEVDNNTLHAHIMLKMNRAEEWIWIRSQILPQKSFSDEAFIERWYEKNDDFNKRFDNAMKGV